MVLITLRPPLVDAIVKFDMWFDIYTYDLYTLALYS